MALTGLLLSYDFPTLRVGRIKRTVIAVSYGRAATAETQQFTLGTFFKIFISTICLHLTACPYLVKLFLKKVADNTFKTTASHYIAVRENGEMTVTAVTAVVDGIRLALRRYFEQTFLI